MDLEWNLDLKMDLKYGYWNGWWPKTKRFALDTEIHWKDEWEPGIWQWKVNGHMDDKLEQKMNNVLWGRQNMD